MNAKEKPATSAQASAKFKDIISLWKSFIPLSLTDMAMAIGEPVRNYAVASLPNASVNLASIGVAKSLAVFFESPIIMILHASNALSRDGKASQKLLSFTLIFSFILSIAFLGLSIPDIFNYLSTHIFSLNFEITEQTRIVTMALCLWPFVIGWRRYFQGVLIQDKKNKVVASASIFRLAFVIGLPLLGMSLNWSGIACAVSSMMGGIIAESIFVTAYCFKNSILKKTYTRNDSSLPRTYNQIIKYYFPLAFSMIIIWGTRALLVFLLSYAIDAKVSLVVWPIVWGFVMVISNGTRMIQQVYISEKDQYSFKTFILFAVSIASVFSLLLVILIFTPSGDQLIRLSMSNVSHLSEQVKQCLILALIFPALTTFQNIFQGELIRVSKTKVISQASVASNLFMAIAAYYFISVSGISGAIALMLSFNIGVILEIFVYIYSIKKSNTLMN